MTPREGGRVANQRLYLRFKPTGEEVMLGKRMVTSGWYGAQSPAAFFEKVNAYCGEHGYDSLDELELVFESKPGWDLHFGEDEA